MSGKGRKRAFVFKDIRPKDPAITTWSEWLPANRSFFQCFRRWLKDSSYSDSALKEYSVAARQAIGFLNKPYWMIDPDADLERFRQHLLARPIGESSRACYHKGLKKFAEYLRIRCHLPPKPKKVNWGYFLGPLPLWLAEDVRAFMRHCQRCWPADRKFEATRSTVSRLTLFLRWAAVRYPLADVCDLTPQKWFDYLDERLGNGINPISLNSELSVLKHMLHFLKEHGRSVCERMFLIDFLDKAQNLPRDVPPQGLRLLIGEIEKDAASCHAGIRRMGLMDRAWFLLMLHSGLRTGEVRFLRLKDIDWERHNARIEQSKGLKDRFVPLSEPTLAALGEYLQVRGPTEALPDHVFIFRHRQLSQSYCYERLRTYGERCGMRVTPHQLRHSCATLLLNAGAPVLAVQAILGHRQVDTTLGYARLYDGTIAADYFTAMAQVERQLSLPEDRLAQPPGAGQLLALVDSLRKSTLNDTQAEAVRRLRAGILALAELEVEKTMEDVKVPISVR